MGGGDSPYQPKLNWLPYFINYFISSNYKSNRVLWGLVTFAIKSFTGSYAKQYFWEDLL